MGEVDWMSNEMTSHRCSGCLTLVHPNEDLCDSCLDQQQQREIAWSMRQQRINDQS